MPREGSGVAPGGGNQARISPPGRFQAGGRRWQTGKIEADCTQPPLALTTNYLPSYTQGSAPKYRLQSAMSKVYFSKCIAGKIQTDRF